MIPRLPKQQIVDCLSLKPNDVDSLSVCNQHQTSLTDDLRRHRFYICYWPNHSGPFRSRDKINDAIEITKYKADTIKQLLDVLIPIGGKLCGNCYRNKITPQIKNRPKLDHKPTSEEPMMVDSQEDYSPNAPPAEAAEASTSASFDRGFSQTNVYPALPNEDSPMHTPPRDNQSSPTQYDSPWNQSSLASGMETSDTSEYLCESSKQKLLRINLNQLLENADIEHKVSFTLSQNLGTTKPPTQSKVLQSLKCGIAAVISTLSAVPADHPFIWSRITESHIMEQHFRTAYNQAPLYPQAMIASIIKSYNKATLYR